MRVLTVVLISLICSPVFAQESDVVAKIEAAMSADIRTEAEMARDRNRRPVETLTFFGLQDDMRVIELLPGGGWYTKILAPVLKEKGELYVAIGTGNVERNLLQQPGFEDVEAIDPESVKIMEQANMAITHAGAPKMLTMLLEQVPAHSIYLVGHSMGNRIIGNAMVTLSGDRLATGLDPAGGKITTEPFQDRMEERIDFFLSGL